jgi:hypothetical protein
MQQRRRPDSTLWKQLERPAHREALEELVRTYGAESLLPLVLEQLRHSPSAERRAGIGCLLYLGVGTAVYVLATLSNPLLLIFPLLQILFSPIATVILLKMQQEQSPRRLNLLRLLRLVARELSDSTLAIPLIRAIQSVGALEDPVLRRELRQELGRLLLRLPRERARQLPARERLVLRSWLWQAMRWDHAGDTEFCLAILLVLGDAQDQLVRPHAWLCRRWHHAERVREAARACLDELTAR